MAKRNKKYFPKPKSKFGGLQLINRLSRIDFLEKRIDQELTDKVAMEYRMAMTLMSQGYANQQNVESIIFALICSMALARLGLGSEYEQLISTALRCAQNIRLQTLAGITRCDDQSTLKLINDALDVYDAQSEEATRAEWVQAIDAVKCQISEGQFF